MANGYINILPVWFNKTDFDQMLPQLPVTRSHNIIERLLRVFGCQIATKVCCGQRPHYLNMNWQANTDKDLLWDRNIYQ